MSHLPANRSAEFDQSAGDEGERHGDFVNSLDRRIQKTHGGSERKKQSQPCIIRPDRLPVNFERGNDA
jgi:hypothetical protein